jgi:peroxiredoxin
MKKTAVEHRARSMPEILIQLVGFKKVRRLLALSLILGMALLPSLIACGQPGNSTTVEKAKVGPGSMAGVAPRVGYKPPNFTLKDLQGKAVELGSFHGKVVFINFWATWCDPCRAEMPAMERLYQDFKDKDFVMLAISEDLEGKSAVEPFVKEFKFTFPILLDQDLVINEQYEVRGIPTTFLIDKTGTIAHKMLGARDWNRKESRKLISKLLQAK